MPQTMYKECDLHIANTLVFNWNSIDWFSENSS